MMRFSQYLLVGGCFLFVSLSIVASGQTKSEREELGYLGPVHTVRTVTVKYLSVAGRRKAKKPTVEFDRYNKRGVRLENSEYDDNGKLTWRVTPILSDAKVTGWRESADPNDISEYFYKFDSAGNKIEESTFDETGKIRNHWTYTYDSLNRLIQETHDSKLKTYTYDSLNRLIRETNDSKVKTYSYDEKGRTKEISTYIHDEKGLTPVNDSGFYRRVFKYANGKYWTSDQCYSADGALVSKTFLTRDRKGDEIENVTYEGDGNLKHRLRYDYKYDFHGNLIRLKQFRLHTSNGVSSYQLEEIEFITIRYFGK